MTDRVLGPRALNRALLARQLLLRRADRPVLGAVEHLIGLHAQVPADPHVGLWSRLSGFAPAALSEALLERRVVRTALMRSTIHLTTAADCAALRPWVQPVLDRDLRTNATHGPPLRGLDLAAVVEEGRALLEREPRTPAELGALLAARWPDLPPASLAYAVRNTATLVQVPPRGLWGRGGATRHTTAEHWLGTGPGAPDPAAAVVRYLRAFGPATVADVQTWSGLTRLGGVVDGLRDRLTTFRDDRGRELVDLPDAPRPDPDVAAPPRLLGQFDNAFLAHADRRRAIPGGRTFARLTREHGLRRPRGPALLSGTLLLDGLLEGTWRVEADREAAVLRLEPFRALTAGEADELVTEASGLLALAAPDGADRRVLLAPR